MLMETRLRTLDLNGVLQRYFEQALMARGQIEAPVDLELSPFRRCRTELPP